MTRVKEVEETLRVECAVEATEEEVVGTSEEGEVAARRPEEARVEISETVEEVVSEEGITIHRNRQF